MMEEQFKDLIKELREIEKKLRKKYKFMTKYNIQVSLIVPYTIVGNKYAHITNAVVPVSEINLKHLEGSGILIVRKEERDTKKVDINVKYKVNLRDDYFRNKKVIRGWLL